MIEHALDATREFTAHMATLAEAEARILKQNRLLREEIEHKNKDHPKDEGNPGKNSKGKRDGDGAAGAVPK